MKGIIFNLLEEIVRREYSVDTWDAVLEKADVDGAYTSLGSYPDEELSRIVGAVATLFDASPVDMLRITGRRAMPFLVQKYPEFFLRHSGTRSFVLTLNDIIHPEVRKLYPGAETPDFVFDTTSPDVLSIEYRSQRKMCAFAEGLIHGAADYYGETATITQPACMHRGDEACTLHVSFQKRTGDA